MRVRLTLLTLLVVPFVSLPLAADNARELARQAMVSYDAGDYAACLRQFDRAREAGSTSVNAAYNAACCAALAGEKESAFLWLERAVKRGYRDLDHLEGDSDLETLHGDLRWAEILASAKAELDADRSSVHSELYELYRADQGDRSGSPSKEDWAAISKRDLARRERVLELIEAEELKVADDYFHAAMVLQHGSDPEHFRMAHELSKKAAELNPEHGTAKWLSAAAWDRYLWNTDQAQIYGTQFRRNPGEPWTLEPFDREAVTDEERAALNVPPLADALKRLEAMNSRLEAQSQGGGVEEDEERSPTSEGAGRHSRSNDEEPL